MNLPNILTTTRIVLVPLLVTVLLTSQAPGRELFGLIVFIAAALTDFFDGYLARRRKQITSVGILLDPIADKLLISSAFISLVEIGLVEAWMVVVVVGREFAVTGLRSVAALKGVVISAKRLGKYKMVSQVFCVGFLIGGKLVTNDVYFIEIGRVLLWIVVLLSLASMIQYFKHFWSVIDIEERPSEEKEPDNVVPMGQKRIS
ncbi:MAG TPA: CDP-diacylglycerol--glycerol-3-phosphate 3-phosphatidyltransferase [Acidobacteriota bacterium]|nr:CDP-diacylglycerol--glycerol-3-phosphate 3-phosphatidyltransferase [Acidobacteriota bacterium]